MSRIAIVVAVAVVVVGAAASASPASPASAVMYGLFRACLDDTLCGPSDYDCSMTCGKYPPGDTVMEWRKTAGCYECGEEGEDEGEECDDDYWPSPADCADWYIGWEMMGGGYVCDTYVGSILCPVQCWSECQS